MASGVAQPLPSFRNPPVSEVGMSVTFQPIGGFTAGHFGRLWTESFAEFDHAEDQPYVKAPVELFGAARAFANLVPFQIVASPGPRLWLVSPDNTELVQLQKDWLCRNWRRGDVAGLTTGDGSSTYPRYSVLIRRFEDSLTRVKTYLADHGLGDILTQQCELSYANHIPIVPPLAGIGDVPGLLSVVHSSESAGSFLPPLEMGGVEFAWVMTPERARLRMNLQAGKRLTDQQDAFILTLTARGAPDSEDQDGIMNFMDKAHEWIVRGFKDVTTSAMHEYWGELT